MRPSVLEALEDAMRVGMEAARAGVERGGMEGGLREGAQRCYCHCGRLYARMGIDYKICLAHCLAGVYMVVYDPGVGWKGVLPEVLRLARKGVELSIRCDEVDNKMLPSRVEWPGLLPQRGRVIDKRKLARLPELVRCASGGECRSRNTRGYTLVKRALDTLGAEAGPGDLEGEEAGYDVLGF